jgi:hypothetical protein
MYSKLTFNNICETPESLETLLRLLEAGNVHEAIESIRPALHQAREEESRYWDHMEQEHEAETAWQMQGAALEVPF